MVSLIKMRPWYMPMVAPFGDDEFDRDFESSGLNVYTKEGVVHVEAPVPGVPAEKVDVQFIDGQLHIKAAHTEQENEKESKKMVYKMERETSFEYTTILPSAIDEKSIEAHIKDGVVYVTAKVAEAAKPKKIAVKTTA